MLECSFGHTFFGVFFSTAQDPTGLVRSHWAGAGLDIKVSLLTQDQFATYADDFFSSFMDLSYRMSKQTDMEMGSKEGFSPLRMPIIG